MITRSSATQPDSVAAPADAEGKGRRGRYVLRAVACLMPYWPHVLGAYLAMFVGIGVAVYMPMVVRRIIDAGIRPGVPQEILVGCAWLMGLAVLGGLCTFLTGRWSEMASQNVAFDIRNRLHEKMHALSFSFHDQAETGQLLARSVGDVERIRFLTGRAFVHLVQMSSLVLGIAVAMIVLNARLALLTLTIVPFILLGAFALAGRLRPLSMRIRDQEGVLTSRIEQNLRGARIVKAFGREPFENARFGELNSALLGLQRREAGLSAFYLPLMHLLAMLGGLLVLVVGGVLTMDGALSLGELVAFMTYVAQLVHPARRFGWVVAAVAQASASAERVFEILDLDAEIVDAPGARPLPPVQGRISFEHVSFAYVRGRQVLDDISFDVLPGEKVALLGGTGSGKSSIINLIPRFYDPSAGRVLVDGLDIRNVTVKSLRDHIGLVLQDTILFASTIRENIAFGRPEASEEDIVAAARAAHAHEFIVRLPGGYDARVGEKGMTLSGGQKQRLSLARAILKNPEILILDDATSSVDTETEQQIQEAMQRLMQGRTSIIIAQRLSTVREADKVIVMAAGRIAAVGWRTDEETPHEQLLRSSTVYADIVALQLRPETLDWEPDGEPRPGEA